MYSGFQRLVYLIRPICPGLVAFRNKYHFPAAMAFCQTQANAVKTDPN